MLLDQLRVVGAHVETRLGPIDCILDLGHLPFQPRCDHRTLNDRVPGFREAVGPEWGTRHFDTLDQVAPALHLPRLLARERSRPWSARDERPIAVDRPVTIHAGDLDGVARFAIEFPVAVRVLLEVAVDAMHAALEMNVFQMNW